MFNLIIYKNLYHYNNGNRILSIYISKNKKNYMFNLLQLSKFMNYSSPHYLIDYYVYKTGHIKNNFYYRYYTNYDGLNTILTKSRKKDSKQILDDIKKELK